MAIENNILSDITVHMKYARYLPEQERRENWEELVTRNPPQRQAAYTLRDWLRTGVTNNADLPGRACCSPSGGMGNQRALYLTVPGSCN